MKSTIKRIFLRDINKELCEAWKAEEIPMASVYCGDIFHSPSESIVSPANSFGFMDGGIDGVYTKHFGDKVQRRVQLAIKSVTLNAELLVGQAIWVATDDLEFPYLISAPTMRVPMPIHDPVDVYLATRAAMKIAISKRYEEILFPGMGTSVGRIAPKVAAKMMAKGIADALNPPAFPVSLGEASGRHFSSLTDTIRKLNTP